jgi:hypothetical protein
VRKYKLVEVNSYPCGCDYAKYESEDQIFYLHLARKECFLDAPRIGRTMCRGYEVVPYTDNPPATISR